MMKAITAALRNRKITLVLAVVVMIFGLYSYFAIPKQEDPDITPPFAMLTTTYPGASPEIVEKLVTKKIEDKLVEIEGYEYSQSYSRDSASIVILRLRNGADIEESWRVLREKMDDLQSELPEDCSKINIKTDLADTAGIIISLTGGNYSYEELEFFAEDLKNELMKIEGISKFDINGSQQKEIKVRVDIGKLNQYMLSLQDVVNIIQASNVEIPSGAIEGSSINVKISSQYETMEDIMNTVVYVSQDSGASVRLKDIANVEMGLEDSSYKIKHNGQNAVLLTGYFVKDKNIVNIGKKVEKTLQELEDNLPEDVTLDKVLFQPEDVSKSTSNFIRNLLEGMIFVIIVVFLGMSLNNAIVVSTAIPLSIMATFIAMYLTGIKLHQISISALIIALGMLVDNAIVISDAIQVRLDRGDDRLQACIDGVKEVAVPVFSSTLTTVAAFIPLLMLDSVAGEYVISVPQIVMLSLSFSYITALFVTPSLAYIFFKPGRGKVKSFSLRKMFMNLLSKALRFRKVTIAVSIGVFALSLYIALQLGLQFFPYADKDMMYINIDSEKSNDLDRTEEITENVFKVLKEQPEVVFYTGAIGDGLPKFYNAIPISTPSKDYAQILIKLDLKKTERFKSNSEFADHLQLELDKRIAGGTAAVKMLELAEPTTAPVIVRISGDDMDTLVHSAEQIKSMLEDIPGTMNIDDDHSDRIYEYNVDLDPAMAAYCGLSAYDVQNEVNIALMGRVATKLRQHGNEYNVRVEGNISSKEDLENFMIKSSVTNTKALLKSVAPISVEHMYPQVKKYDRDMTVMVYSDVKTGYNPVDIERKLEEKLKETDMGDVSIVFDGEREKIVQYFGDLGVSMIFAVILVYIILLFQFRSFLQPFIILVTIPLSVIGSILGLAIFRQPLSFTALLGVVSLAGIVVNNAILLIDFINAERAEGKDVNVSCVDAVDKRFRPIMLTTTTTVIGLIPLALGGSSLMVPMAVSLMSGLMVSTLLTMVVIPVVYSLFEKRTA
ncbi:efflux RND transporter permease subunit [Lutispora thermophila]|uniref:Multidrug efflux pump subunit AcrB n=1 Tax=Lutispora thermophila DSM 19022 TaxID=1122184 RepID=A0A1M6E2X4_9FIRM|nr:efflux RND transporter permease subunit [Lutispora thermophila]SHI79743.1 Multidrug efflux pump subunit AcrB [Lutispora thermophila DSM 19022]